ncbi:glycosyl hydrolase [Botryobacter ruber]|uniref:glycosyl hydrolase n=1 Tax=Botryobacter ruber TaxID=2171629 RepID=UPI00196A7A0B|nr:glycosyl hydrolase [Botryobacter ruber]
MTHPNCSFFLKGMMIAVFVCCSLAGRAQDAAAPLKQGFENPPAAAWPRTWWHWTKSNVTKEGITKDLEWMKRVGIAGFQLADVNAGGGQDVDNKILFGSPAWLETVKYTAAEAERLGLEMAIFSSAGWSLTGGPWVKPEQAMKKLVWSELQVEGGKTFNGKLPQPPSTEGPIQNLSRGGNQAGGTRFYGDCAVIVYRTPAAESPAAALTPTVTTSAGTTDARALLDDELNTSLTVRTSKKDGTAWVQYAFAKPIQAQAVSIAGPRGIPFGRVTASDDGKNFRTLAVLPGKQGYRGGTVRTFAFPKTTARYFRLELTGAPRRPADVISEAPPQPDSVYVLNDFKLHNGGRVHRWEDKAGFNFLFEYGSTATPGVAADAAIPPADIVDLTSRMRKDGTLQWNVPKGNWTIMRFGYSLTGAKNRPAVPAGLGYEVDKLSRQHTEAYMENYTKPLVQALGPLYGKSLRYMLLDSWEAGIQNWTDEMLTEFQKRRGYDPTPYLPVLSGKVVGSAEVSDRFLWDFRRTLVDMFAENHYGVITNFLHRQGIKTYGEAGGVSLETIEDALLNKKFMDIPMGEFWVKDLHPSAMYYEDVRGAASASHAYGKNLTAAEAFTGGNFESPYTLKKISDYWFTQGINQLVFHTSAHQPLDTKPGNAMVGTHLHRNITWAEQARPFITYLARNSFMLQQGQYVADIAYLLNEGAPSTMPFWGGGLEPATPKGYAFDYLNADVLLNRMSVDADGQLVLPDGMSYKVLVLPETDQMTVPLLRKIRELVAGGATVVGPRPVKAPGLAGYPGSDAEVKELANEIWGDLDGSSRTRRSYGKGHVLWGLPLKEVMASIAVSPDVAYSQPLDSDVSWIHRRTDAADIYFLVNRSNSPQDLNVRFRIGGKDVELWHPGTGQTEPAGYSTSDNHTTVPLHLAEREAVFVVFSRKAPEPARTVAPKAKTVLSTIEGPWEVTFPNGLGAPAKINMATLNSWTNNPEEGVKYFSGTATYHKTIKANRNWFKGGNKLLLDLGKVGDVAEVLVNGKQLDVVWKAPYQVDVTDVLRPGNNLLEIKVTNEWTNRLVGDKAAGPDKKVLDTYIAPFGGQYELAESGLLGPVKVISVGN